MKTLTVFFSWQSDLQPKTNRHFIQDCLKKAAKQLNRELVIEEAERNEGTSATPKVVVDHDTEGVAGTPDIFPTILDKIENCDIFVGDVSFVGRSHDGSRLLPNPNVLIELGYAMAQLKSQQITLVMDTKYGGANPEERPFDIRHKRQPIFFDSSQDQSSEEKELIAAFKKAIRLVLESGAIGGIAGRLKLTFVGGAQETTVKFEASRAKQSVGEAEKSLAELVENEQPKRWAGMGPSILRVSSDEFKSYLSELKDYTADISRCLKLSLEIRSDSDTLIENCDVVLILPSGTRFLEDLREPPREPVPGGQYTNLNKILKSLRKPDPLKLKINTEAEAQYKVDMVKRGLPVRLKELYIQVLDTEISSFVIAYQLICAVPHETVEGELTVALGTNGI